MPELCDLTAHELAGRLRSGEATAADILDSALRRVADVDERLHAFLVVTEDLARREAGRVDDLLARGETLPPRWPRP